MEGNNVTTTKNNNNNNNKNFSYPHLNFAVERGLKNSPIWKNRLLIFFVLKLIYCFCAIDFSVFAIVQAVNT